MFQPGGIQTSGTYQFLPSTPEIITNAFSRVRVKRTMMTPTHLADAVMEMNLMLAAFNNKGPNLAQVDLKQITLVQGTATYSILPETVMILDVYITQGGQDRYLWPISRTEYAALPNKTQQGFPNQYWFDRLIAPTITLWLVPDGNGPYTLNYYRFRQVQDATVAGNLNPEVPNRAIDALVAGLAHRLARHYAPDLEDKRKLDAVEAWDKYADQDTENTVLYLTPALSGYRRI